VWSAAHIIICKAAAALAPLWPTEVRPEASAPIGTSERLLFSKSEGRGDRVRQSLARMALSTAIALVGLAGASSLLPGATVLAQAPRDYAAEAFVQTQGQRAVSILGDRSRSAQDRIGAFRALVEDITDVPRIMNFVLGKYARTITPDQRRRFAPIFREYEQAFYREQLSAFQGDTLVVTGSLVRRPGDVLVKTTISGGDASQPAEVYWRVLGTGANRKVVDLEVAGVWLAITQQQDFVSTIDNHGGDIDALISQLEKQLQARRHSPEDH
jgi:phospholipid transport system substrate-binding protein